MLSSSMQHSEEQSRRNRRRIISAIVVVVVIIAVGLIVKGRSGGGKAAAEGAGAQQAMPPMPVDVDTARLDTIVDALRATGRIEAVSAVDLRPDEQGRITRLYFAEGQSVATGAPLLKIDDEMLRAQAGRAEAERDLAKQQLERVRRLRAENAAPVAEVERAEANARTAEAALAVLKLQIERTTVRAPFTGVVGQRFVSTGDYVTTSSRLLTLQSVNPQRAVFEVPERYAVRLQPGQTVEFTVAAQPDRVFAAQVEFIDPVVQTSSRTIVVKARAPNPGRELRPGMFIEARLATAKRAGVIVIPEDAVQPMRTANVVWAVVDGKASRRVVQLGTRTQGRVEIVDGIKAGELVVVGGLERMAEGMAVAPQPRGGAPAPATPPPGT